MSSFYRPNFGGNKFNGWEAGLNNSVAIVGVSELTGEELAKRLKYKTDARGYEVKALDINLVIEIAKKDYEYTKKITYAFAFDRDEEGNVTMGKSKDGKMDLMNAFKFFDLMLCKPGSQIGIDTTGKVITEAGKPLTSLTSYMKSAVSPDTYKYFAYMFKKEGSKYWDCKFLVRQDVESALNLAEKEALYWKGKQPSQQSYNNSDDPFADSTSMPEKNDVPDSLFE